MTIVIFNKTTCDVTIKITGDHQGTGFAQFVEDILGWPEIESWEQLKQINNSVLWNTYVTFEEVN